MSRFHTREAPNGCQADIEIECKSLDHLKYGQKVKIVVGGVERNAVVDVIVANCWGGAKAALKYWEEQHTPHPQAMMKIVWQDDVGDWEESRDVYPASRANYEAWIKAFDGDTPPTPMP